LMLEGVDQETDSSFSHTYTRYEHSMSGLSSFRVDYGITIWSDFFELGSSF
jgi:hypothetical protein